MLLAAGLLQGSGLWRCSPPSAAVDMVLVSVFIAGRAAAFMEHGHYVCLLSIFPAPVARALTPICRGTAPSPPEWPSILLALALPQAQGELFCRPWRIRSDQSQRTRCTTAPSSTMRPHPSVRVACHVLPQARASAWWSVGVRQVRSVVGSGRCLTGGFCGFAFSLSNSSIFVPSCSLFD